MKLNKISKAIFENRKYFQSTALCTAAMVSVFSVPTFAQEEPANNAEEQAPVNQEVVTKKPRTAKKDVEVIEVRGMRGTMSRSLNLKKNTEAITDGIAAADFGDLPGLSISDVIENITSVSGHRGKGSASEMSIRGLGPFLGYSTFNGRTVTSAGYSRAVNFKKFPSELVDSVVVYKSQQADIVEGGVAGTINVNALRALDHGEEQASVELMGIYNETSARIDGNDGLGNQITASMVKIFETDNYGDVGFTLGFQRTNSANPEESMLTSSTMYSCATQLADGTGLGTTTGDCEDNKNGTNTNVTRENIGDYAPGSVFLTPSSWTYRNQDESDDRSSVVGTVQWQPTDLWNINVDVEYSNNHYWEDRHDFTVSTARYALSEHVIDDDMNLLYREGLSKMESKGYYRDEDETYNGIGLNVEHVYNDDLTLFADFSYSKSHRNRTSYQSRIQTGDYWAYSLDNRENRLTELNFLPTETNNGMVAFDPTNPMSWSPEMNDGKDGQGSYKRQMDYRTDKIYAAKFDAHYYIDTDFFSAIKAGVRYSHQNLYSDLDTDVALNPDGSETSEYKTKDTAETNPLLENCFIDWNNDEWFDSEDGPGFEGQEFAQMDGRCGYGYLSPGGNDFYDHGPRADRRSTGDVDIDENITSVYLMGEITTQMFGLPVTGNVGVRAVHTEIKSKGYQTGYYIKQDEETYSLEPTGDLDESEVTHTTTDYLPSLNLTFHYSDAFLIRTAAYRAMSRPNLQDMSAGRVIKDSEGDDVTNPDDLISGVTGGNPYMEPLMSNNIELSLEWYPSLDTAMSIAFYGKQFEANFRSVTEPETMTIDNVDVNVDVITNTYTDDTSYLRGFEITAQHHFTELPEPFNGLGTKLAYNYANSSFENEDGTFGDVYNLDGDKIIDGFVDPANVFGFSKNVFSGSVYWEGDKLSLRVLYKSRSEYFQPNSGSQANRYVEPFEYIDFNAKYKITKDTSISFKVLNALDEPQYMTRGADATPTLISSSGSKYFLSVKTNF